MRRQINAWHGSIVILALVLGALGCASGGGAGAPANESPIEAEGTARIDPLAYAGQVPWALAFSDTLRATAELPLDAAIPNPDQRVLAAQAAARREAMRALARRILALPDSNQKALSQSVADRPAIGKALEDLLDKQAKVSLRTADQQVIAEASIDGPAVLSVLREQGVPLRMQLSDLPPDQQQALKSEAYRQALMDLRARLKSRILEVKDPGGEPLAQRFNASADRMSALDQALLLLQADKVTYREDGTCVATGSFSPAQARALAGANHPAWEFWKR